jgi:quinol-cytochrome oxidoreductase complex cytochrome b subunit
MKDKIVLWMRGGVANHLMNYPTPLNINYFWSFGSMLGLCLGVQIATGLALAMNYTAHIDHAFDSIEHIMRDVRFGWLLRYMHSNGASMIFFLIYAHMARGAYYQSYKQPREHVRLSGSLIFVLMAGTAFLGYVLPWGQMSFWGITVITNILTALPIFGEPIVIWIWGGFSVGNATLTRFYGLHFLLPLVIAALAILHLLILHRVGSSNPVGIDSSLDSIRFFPYFFLKDVVIFLAFMVFFLYCVCYQPNLFGHPDNYIKANPMVTPTHIVPERYFLPYYIILKSIPSKIGGAAAMALSMGCLFLLPFVDTSKRSWVEGKFLWDFFFGMIVLDIMLLGRLGGKAPSAVTLPLNQFLTFYYFFHFFIIVPALSYFENNAITKRLFNEA